MKKLTNQKKLTLARETVATLEKSDLEQALGGIISSDNKACSYTAAGPRTTCWC